MSIKNLTHAQMVRVVQQRVRKRNFDISDILEAMRLPPLSVFLPYENVGTDKARFDANRAVSKAYYQSMRTVSKYREKGKCDSDPFKRGWMSFDSRPSRITIDSDDGPQASLVANYSGVLHGGYMGAKRLGSARPKPGRVRVVATRV